MNSTPTPSQTVVNLKKILASPLGQAYAIIMALVLLLSTARLLLGNSDAFNLVLGVTLGGTVLGLTAWALPSFQQGRR